MKLIALLLFAGCACAQTPTTTLHRDSIPNNAMNPMPISRPGNAFYRDPNDPPQVVRATLDNMPIKGPDSSVHHTMQLLPGYGPKIRLKKR